MPVSYREKQLLAIRNLEKAFSEGAQPATVVPIVADYENDSRMCLTAVCFLPQSLASRVIEEVSAPLRLLEPHHYYYPLESLHITVQNLRTIAEPPRFDSAHVETARRVLSTIIPGQTEFEVDLQGVIRLPNSISIAGFSDESLGQLATSLRPALREAAIPDDKQYGDADVVFANVTICRFVQPPGHLFRKAVERVTDEFYGKVLVDLVQLIQTNAVCHPNKTSVLDSFALRGRSKSLPTGSPEE